jgi:hypothetical protein
MAEKKSIPENPLIERMVSEGAANAISFRGYIGSSATQGHVTLNASLDDLSQPEFSRADRRAFAR